MKHPSQYWSNYKTLAYGKEPLSATQELEVRRAFHAGIEATFKAVIDESQENENTEEVGERIQWFRRHNRATALAMTPTGLQ